MLINYEFEYIKNLVLFICDKMHAHAKLTGSCAWRVSGRNIVKVKKSKKFDEKSKNEFYFCFVNLVTWQYIEN